MTGADEQEKLSQRREKPSWILGGIFRPASLTKS
jgi:hypothetical protein